MADDTSEYKQLGEKWLENLYAEVHDFCVSTLWNPEYTQYGIDGFEEINNYKEWEECVDAFLHTAYPNDVLYVLRDSGFRMDLPKSPRDIFLDDIASQLKEDLKEYVTIIRDNYLIGQYYDNAKSHLRELLYNKEYFEKYLTD